MSLCCSVVFLCNNIKLAISKYMVAIVENMVFGSHIFGQNF
jgi:hypothetical protein